MERSQGAGESVGETDAERSDTANAAERTEPADAGRKPAAEPGSGEQPSTEDLAAFGESAASQDGPAAS